MPKQDKSWGIIAQESILMKYTTDRDLLAEPIRELELILQRIRTGSFLPDASRSGMIAEATVEDRSKVFVERKAKVNPRRATPLIHPVMRPPCIPINTLRICMIQCWRKKSGIQTSICTNIVEHT